MTPEQDIQEKLDRLTDLVQTANAEAQEFVMRNRVVTCKQIINKFCSGPAAEGMPEMISDCVGSTTLEELMETVAHWHDFDNEGQAALFILKYLDYEAD